MGGVNKTESEGNYTRITSNLGKLNHACTAGIKKFFRNLIEKLSNFIRKTASWILRTVHFSAWENTKQELQIFARQIRILDKQINCLRNMRDNPPGASAELDYFLGIGSHYKDDYVDTEKYLDKMGKINAGAEESLDRLIPNQWIKPWERPFIKNREAWAKKCIPEFEKKIRKLQRLSTEHVTLAQNMIMNTKEDHTAYKDNSAALIAAKKEAQKYYDEFLKDRSEQFEGWIRPNGIGISHDIYEEEKEYVAGLKKLMLFERENIKKLRNGEPSALNLMAESRIVLRDRDMTLYQENFDKIPEILLKMKILEVKDAKEDASKAMQTFKREAEERFKVDDIPYLE